MIHRILVDPSAPSGRDGVGGTPYVDAPARCQRCQRAMVPFLQFDVRAEFGLPFAAGSHFIAMMCPEHNDVPDSSRDAVLPDGYWERGGHYLLRLYPPSIALAAGGADGHLVPAGLTFEKADDELTDVGAGIVVGSQGLKVGGTPSWAQNPELHTCCCGADMAFLAQVPENHPFPQRADAPEQPDSFSSTDYCLFLGNEVYFFACARQCHAGAVYAAVQN